MEVGCHPESLDIQSMTGIHSDHVRDSSPDRKVGIGMTNYKCNPETFREANDGWRRNVIPNIVWDLHLITLNSQKILCDPDSYRDSCLSAPACQSAPTFILSVGTTCLAGRQAAGRFVAKIDLI